MPEVENNHDYTQPPGLHLLDDFISESYEMKLLGLIDWESDIKVSQQSTGMV